MKFLRETKAYTSIFLCLVLLPMVTYSSMIIDASRLQSAKVQVQSAGDLAMNAAMSEYEKVLEDMYGLFATGNLDNIRPAVQKYFEETISEKFKNIDKSQSVEIAKSFTDMSMNAGKNPDGSDIDYTNFCR